MVEFFGLGSDLLKMFVFTIHRRAKLSVGVTGNYVTVNIKGGATHNIKQLLIIKLIQILPRCSFRSYEYIGMVKY